MALEYNINIYETDEDDATKTMVTFMVKDKSLTDNTFIITKRITTGSKTKEKILEEAHSQSQSEVNEWQETFTTVGKTWNPDKKSIE